MSRRHSVPLALLLVAATLGARTAASQELEPKAPGRHWQAVVLPGADTLRFTLYVPQGIEDAARTGKKVPLVVGAHFGGRVTPYMGGEYGDLLVFPGLEELGAVIVAPDAHNESGWSREDDEQRLVWLVRALEKTYPIDPKRAVMTGFSAGGAHAWWFANRHQDLFSAVIPIAAPIRDGLPNPWKIPVYVIASTADRSVALGPLQAYVEAQRAAGAPVELHTVDGIPHNRTNLFADPLAAAVPWLQALWKRGTAPRVRG